MGVIEDLVRNLGGAQRSLKRAQRAYDEAAALSASAREEVQRWEVRVRELEAAISLLRNGLRTATTETSSGNVTPLKR